MKRPGICIVLFLLFLQPARMLFPAVLFSPDLEWKSIKTEHFWIHYHQGLEAEAMRLALLAEKTHRRLSPAQRWDPFFRTDVILVDNTDSANGFSTPYPFNRVQIFVTRPELDSVLNNFGDWLDLVFTHEYTHTLNLDEINGLPSVTRYTLGRACFPNIFLPIWMTEGNAVYSESRLAPFGRNNSTYTDMIMRMEYTDGNFKSITEASHFPRRWPTGSVPYLYGGLFVDYLEKKYGSGRFSAVMEENSDNVIPFLVNKNANDVYGDNFLRLWKEWESYLKIYYSRQMEQIGSHKLTGTRAISSSGYTTYLPRFSRDGGSIYYARITNYSEPALMSFDLKSGKTVKVCAIHSPNSISTSPEGTVILSDMEYFESFSLFNDAFEIGLGSKRMSRGLRGSYIDVSGDANKAVFVRNDRDYYSLMISDTAFTSMKPTIDTSDIQMAYTRFSPDGTRIVFTIKDRSGNADLVLYDIRNGSLQRLMSDRFNDITPTWHPDGNRIIFSSDRKTAYNLYEINLNTMTLSRLTNFAGGAFSPDISPDGSSIAFALYGARGFDINLMDYPDKAIETEQLTFTLLPAEFFSAPTAAPSPENPSPESYSPLRSVFPPYWLPVIGTEEINKDRYDQLYGVFFPGMDTLYRHFYSVNFYAYNVQKRAVLELDYMLTKFYPNILVNYKNEALFYGKDDFPWADSLPYGLRRTLSRSGTVGLDFPIVYYLSSHEFLVSYKYDETITDIYTPLSAGIEHYRDLLTRVRGVYVYTGSKEYTYSISKEDGRDFYIISDIYSSALGSDLSFYKAHAEYAEYLPGFARNNVILLRLRGGASFDNPSYLAPFNLGRFEKGKTAAPDIDDEELGLRGYPSGVVFANRVATAAAEYRFPLLQRDAGYGTIPVLFRDLWLVIFGEYGNVWNGRPVIADFKSSAGAELHMRLTLGYYLDLDGYIGFARGFGDHGESQVYFGVGTYTEGAFKNLYKSMGYL